jgi:cyclopropane fatty-acyl-phospholipid synthase-like methyltransferase
MQEQKATSSHYAKVATHYNHAFFYGDSINYQNRVLQKVLHHLQLKPSDQVVDIGCGTNNWGQSKINMVTRCSTFYNSLKT